MLVVATVMYRFIRDPAVSECYSESDDDYTTPIRPPMTTVALTTIDFSALAYPLEDMQTTSRQTDNGVSTDDVAPLDINKSLSVKDD